MAHTLRYDAGASAYDRLTGRWSRMYIPGVLGAAEVSTGSHVLDVATGTGDAAIVAADLVGSTGRVVAVDISAPMLHEAVAKAAGRQIEFMEADAQSLPFAEGTFDALVCLFGLMFLPDQVAALRAFRRTLRPNGAVVVTCWDRSARAPFAGLAAEALSAQLREDREDLLRPFSLSDPQANVALFQAAGFTDVRIALETQVSQFTSFNDDFWEPIEAGGGRLGQAYLGLPVEAREAVRQEVFGRLPVRTPAEPFSLEHSAWVVIGSG
jgi:SAM-dependent methyltransferase